MAFISYSPLSVSCGRFMDRQTCSSLPYQWRRTNFGGSVSLYFGVRNPLALYPFSSKKKNNPPPGSGKIVCVRGRELAAVTEDSWDESVLNSNIPVLVEFFAGWCGPCRMVHRVVEEIAEEYAGKVKCLLLNADNDLQVAEDYGIQVVPVVVLFKNGEKQESLFGTQHKETYEAAIKKLLGP